jgi:hypothetical protein
MEAQPGSSLFFPSCAAPTCRRIPVRPFFCCACGPKAHRVKCDVVRAQLDEFAQHLVTFSATETLIAAETQHLFVLVVCYAPHRLVARAIDSGGAARAALPFFLSSHDLDFIPASVSAR